MHIISHGTIEVINEYYLKNILRVLKKGGVACITLPSVRDNRCPKHDIDTYEYMLEDGPEKGIVHSFYSKDALIKYLTEFEILEIEEIINNFGNSHWNVVLKKH